MAVRVAFVVLAGLLLFAVPANAQRLTDEEKRRACADAASVELCFAARRGSAERRQFTMSADDRDCRMTGLTRADLNPTGRFVPLCRDASDAMTNAELKASCDADLRGACRYFLDAAVARSVVEARMRARMAWCFRKSADHFAVLAEPVEFLPGLFSHWLRAHPGQENGPAALGIEQALAYAYPCTPQEAVIKMQYLLIERPDGPGGPVRLRSVVPK